MTRLAFGEDEVDKIMTKMSKIDINDPSRLDKTTGHAEVDKSQKGAATLPTVILLSLMIIAIGIGITAVSLDESFVALGQQQAAQAETYAETGAQDALIRVARNKTYACISADCYLIDMAAGGCAGSTACAKVTVSAGTGAGGDPKIITSKGLVNNNIRSVQVSVLFDSSLNGQIATTTWTDLTN